MDQPLAKDDNGSTSEQQQPHEFRIVIKNVDMSEEMQQTAISVAQEARSKSTVEKEIAGHIKKEFDKRFGPTWHVVVGRHYGSYVTHESKHFIYFYLDNLAVLLFKTV